MKVFTVDVSRCNGCYVCQIACKDEHCGNDWTPYAKAQPEFGHFWLKLNEFVCGTVPKVKMHYVPVLCMHCDNAPCINTCSVEGAIYKREDGLVIIDPTKCTGCKDCMDACPHKVIYFNDDLNIAQKCTGCAHLLDDGWKEPRCVDACPTECLKFVDESEVRDILSESETLNPQFGTESRVYYTNIPKKFIAGTVYDPGIKEVIIDASCTLTGEGITLTTKTDDFGDFWFEGLEIGKYSLVIEKEGKTKQFENLYTGKDVNLGDIGML